MSKIINLYSFFIKIDQVCKKRGFLKSSLYCIIIKGNSIYHIIKIYNLSLM